MENSIANPVIIFRGKQWRRKKFRDRLFINFKMFPGCSKSSSAQEMTEQRPIG